MYVIPTYIKSAH